jgi:hypothetical protein
VPIRDYTGDLFVPLNPTSECSAASRWYVDEQIANVSAGGGTLSSSVVNNVLILEYK